MASKVPAEFILHVIFEAREDGGLRARCPSVPNFLLSHSDPGLLQQDVELALETILSDMYGMQMKVRRIPELAEALDCQVPLPHICAEQSYVGRIEAS